MVPNVSIIVPVYNGSAFIGKCIESILRQTLKELEIIVVDDGSEDNSGEICRDLSQKDSRVKVLHKENGGPSSARNLGLRVAKGKYIGFVDSDDEIEESMYEKLYKKIEENRAEIALCGFKEIDRDRKNLGEFKNPLNGYKEMRGTEIKKELETMLLKGKVLGYSSLWNKLYKRSYILKNNLVINENISMAEDLCFNIAALSNASNICAINEALYIYRKVNENSIMNRKEKAFYLNLATREEMLKILKETNISKEVYMSFRNYEENKTAAEFLEQIKIILVSRDKGNEKFGQLYKLIHDPYFVKSLEEINNRHLVLKAKIILKVIRAFLHLENYFNAKILKTK